MWFLFISIQTHFHTINKRNCNLGEINWLSTLLFRGGKMWVMSHKVIHRRDKSFFPQSIAEQSQLLLLEKRTIKTYVDQLKYPKVRKLTHPPTSLTLTGFCRSCSVIHHCDHRVHWAVSSFILTVSPVQLLPINYIPRHHWSPPFYQTKESSVA